MSFKINVWNKIHTVAIGVVLTERLMPIRARPFQDTKVVAHITFITTAVAPQAGAIFCNQHRRKKVAAAAVVKAVNDWQFFERFIARVEYGIRRAVPNPLMI